MFNTIKKLLGIKPSVNLDDVVARGAIIVDVRSQGEYAEGHVNGSINLPLPGLSTQLSKLTKDKPIITCCASGMRSGSAKLLLQKSGFQEVYNGGSWYNLKKYSK